MIEFEGITYNALISRRIQEVLEEHDPTLVDVDASQLETKITKSIFMAAIAKVNNMAFFPKVGDFCDSDLLERCDPARTD